MEHVEPAPTGRATPTNRRPVARILDWIGAHSGYQGSPSEQALEAVAHIAYDRFR